MTLDDLLLEISYQLPKGYPTIVDGKFVDREEVLLINKFLLERGIGELPVPPAKQNTLLEAKPHDHIDAKYVPNIGQSAKWSAVGVDDLEQFADKPFVAVNNTQVSAKDKVLYVKGGNVNQISGTEAKALGKNVTYWKSDALPNTYLAIHKVNTNIVTQYKGNSQTDTDIKEGLVFAFFNSSVSTPFTADNYTTNLKQLKKDLPKSKSLGATAYTRVDNFVSRAMKVKPDKKILSIFNETLSQGLRLQDYSDFVVERDQTFRDVRDTASQVTGEPADKWCPGDVYLIKRGSENLILAGLQKALENTEVGYVNNLFINDWGKKTSKTNAVIVAVSLKMAKAQAGKAKAYLKRFTEDDKVFNVDEKEQKMSYSAVLEGIARLRKEIAAILKRSKEATFDYTIPSGKITKEPVARMKYAALKLVKYLLEREDDPAAAIKGALQFGMSLSGVNPTFFKAVGNTDGSPAKIQEFEAGEHISYFTAVPGQKPVIKIADNNTANSVQFTGMITLGDEKLDFLFQSRSNGAAQATLEIQKLKPIKL